MVRTILLASLLLVSASVQGEELILDRNFSGEWSPDPEGDGRIRVYAQGIHWRVEGNYEAGTAVLVGLTQGDYHHDDRGTYRDNTDDIYTIDRVTRIPLTNDLKWELRLEYIYGVAGDGDIDEILECDVFPDMPTCDGRENDVELRELNWARNTFGRHDDDFTWDGFIDIDDLNVVRNNFGRYGEEVIRFRPAATIPEPHAAAMFWLGIAVAAGLLHFVERRREVRT